MAVFKKHNPETKPKLTKNEKLTLGISILALLLTLWQLVFSSPMFSKFFYSPEVLGTEERTISKKGTFVSTYKVCNVGNKPAENLLISVSCFAKDYITIIPTLDYDVQHKKNGEPLKDIMIKANTFLPKDQIIIVVDSDSSDINSFERQMRAQNATNWKIPSLSVIKYSEGFGKIQRLK